ncbi:DUF1549 domain-containing protein, partial [uncultured Gimesia sp.]|uniref:DUF1549 domain-containing protein n=1 Tax=uncultured Gimesia sp. TaxID=1678688 RepID=UPI002608C117
MHFRLILLSLAGFLTLSVDICLAEKVEPKKSVSKSKIDFSRDIRPLLSDNCFHCHGPDTKHREGDLRLDIEAAAKASSISPGHSEKSELYTRISSTDPDLQMPPAESNKKLTPAQVELFKRWIDEGAEWTSHWSFIAPKKSALPAVKNSKWVRNSIDQFVLSQIERQQGKPADAANRRTLIRRLSLDLTGLPPSIAEVNAFLNDRSPDAYEKVVDRLLTSKHYGERMALMWLDAARYGDTSV